jgi:hypothetical protein
VGGAEVTVAITAVGGMGGVVGSAATPVVEVGTCAWVLEAGGLLLAGNLQDVATRASITSNNPMKMIFLFILFSLAFFSVHPLDSTNVDILHHFMIRFGWFQ